jgi:hypothetical protein
MSEHIFWREMELVPTIWIGWDIEEFRLELGP